MRITPPRMAAVVAAFAMLVAVSPASAQLSVVGVPGMRLVYLDPSETFLVPHAARTFLNSLAFQRRLFDFHPKDPVMLLLTDISDSGNAGASVVPRNVVTVEIAPLNFAFETIAGNDRMNILMNHELVHIATMDQAAGQDRMFRRLREILRIGRSELRTRPASTHMSTAIVIIMAPARHDIHIVQ